MKKVTLLLMAYLCFTSVAVSQRGSGSDEVEETGWLVYYLDHVIWFQSKLPPNVKSKAFFTLSNSYRNGLIIDHISEAKAFKSQAKCYTVKTLTNIDTVTKKEEHAISECIWIAPAKAKVIRKPATEPLDLAGSSFKRARNEVTIEYWFLTNYTVTGIELLR